MGKINFLLFAALFLCSSTLLAQRGSALAANSDRTSSVRTVTSSSSSPSVGEEWEFLSGLSQDFSAEEQAKANHAFGGKVGCMLQLVKSLYFTKEEVVPGDPQTRTVLKKPEIYKAVSGIEKYLKKQVKEGQMGLEQAQQDFTQVLQVALAAVDTDATTTFEDALHKNRKNASAQLSVFYKVKVKSIY